MKKLFLSAAVLVAISGNVFADNKADNAQTFAKDFKTLDLAKDVKLGTGEVLGCSKKGANGEYTRFYLSTDSVQKEEVLTGSNKDNTDKMFTAVSGKKAGDSVSVDIPHSDAGFKKAEVYATSDADKVCAVLSK